MSLCSICNKADNSCPVYPQETKTCVEFFPHVGYNSVWKIIFNGRTRYIERTSEEDIISYDTIKYMTNRKGVVTTTWSIPKGMSGTLCAGQTTKLHNGMIINATHTGAA